MRTSAHHTTFSVTPAADRPSHALRAARYSRGGHGSARRRNGSWVCRSCPSSRHRCSAAACAGHPRLFQRLAPAGHQHFIEIKGDADIGIGRHQGQIGVARMVEAPWSILMLCTSTRAQFLDGAVGRSGIGDHAVIGRFGRLRPAFDELLFIEGDGVDGDFHAAQSIGVPIAGKGKAAASAASAGAKFRRQYRDRRGSRPVSNRGPAAAASRWRIRQSRPPWWPAPGATPPALPWRERRH